MKRGRRTNEGSDYERSCESSRVESSRVVISTESSGWKGRRRQSFTIVAFQVLLASKVDRSPASNQRSRTISGKKRFAIRVLRFFAKIRTINSFLRDIFFRSIETQTGAKNFVARVAVKGGRKPQPPFHLLSLSLSLSANSTRRKEAWRRRVKYFQPIYLRPTLDSLLCLRHSTLRVIRPLPELREPFLSAPDSPNFPT